MSAPCPHHPHSGAVITTFSGRHVNLLHPDPSLIAIDDIAAALSRVARFVGHTQRTYTVAEHLLLGVEFCTPAARLRWFSHDFTEAYLGDVSGPLKNVPAMRWYRDLEAKWDRAIRDRFGIPTSPSIAREVRAVDQRMLATEMRDLKGVRPLSTDPHQPFALQLPAAEPHAELLRERFLAKFEELVAGTEGAIA